MCRAVINDIFIFLYWLAEVDAVMEKLRKACVPDYKCSKRSYVLARILTCAPNQNL